MQGGPPKELDAYINSQFVSAIGIITRVVFVAWIARGPSFLLLIQGVSKNMS